MTEPNPITDAVDDQPPGPDAAAAPVAAVSVPPAPELSPAACGARLAEMFPALFGTAGPPKPIKLRIKVDIQQRAPGVFTKRVLSLFLSRYTTGNAYIKALLQSTHRFDLDGQPAGDITAEHRAAATEELARRRALQEARRAAEREAWRAADKQAREAQRGAEREAHREAQREHAAQDHQRRDRAALLRAFETSTLGKANFCALKGLAEADLDAALLLARQEREQRPPLAQQQPQRAHPPGPPRHGR
jgi:ProP effector